MAIQIGSTDRIGPRAVVCLHLVLETIVVQASRCKKAKSYKKTKVAPPSVAAPLRHNTQKKCVSPPCHTLQTCESSFWCARRRARWRIWGGPNRAASCDSRCEEVPSAEAFKDNICLNKTPSHVGRFGEGSCGVRAPTPTHAEGGGRLFPSLIKERILRVCNAALRIKEEQSAKKKIKNRKKKLWTCAGETPLRQSLRGELFVLL